MQTTCSGPSASAASAAVSPESIPPETPTTTSVKPFFATWSRGPSSSASRICSSSSSTGATTGSVASPRCADTGISTTGGAGPSPPARAGARRPARDDAALLVEDEAVPVEDELVLRADGVHERDPAGVVSRAGGEHLLALGALAEVEGRGGDVGDDVRAGEREVRRGRPRLPDVLADRRSDERLAP